MNLWQKLKFIWKTKNVADELVKEAKLPTTSGKPGWKTTEFWLTAAIQAGTLWASIRGFIPPKYALVIEVIGGTVYTIARTVLKAVGNIQTATAATTLPDGQPLNPAN